MNCGKCGGECYDNREQKASGKYKPNAPDFACKDKACGWKLWPPKDKKESDKRESKGTIGPRAPKWTWQTLYRDYDRCWRLVEKVMVESSKRTKIGFTTADLHAAAATVFIRATQDGVGEPPKPVTAAELSERPEALDDDDDSDLPF